MAFLVLSFNILGVQYPRVWVAIIPIPLFVISLISWDVGPAQFNSGLALAQLAFQKNAQSTIVFIVTVITQFVGTVLGFVLTLLLVQKIEFSEPWSG